MALSVGPVAPEVAVSAFAGVALLLADWYLRSTVTSYQRPGNRDYACPGPKMSDV